MTSPSEERLALVVADEGQQRARDRLAHEAWGGGLTVEQFVQREAQLRGHAWARRCMTSWLLVEEAAPGVVLASCETFRMASRLDGAEGATYGVASVYTEPRLRGRGHALALMQRLPVEVARRDRSAQALVLYSDVGAALYERAGYALRPAVDVSWDAAPGNAAATVDALVAESQLAAVHARLAPPSDRFLVWPEAAQLDWHCERERAYATLLGRPRPGELAVGATAGASTMLWAGDLKNGQLVVLLVDGRSPAELRALRLAAARVAHAAGLARVIAWHQPLACGDTSLLAPPTARDGSLPMIHPLSPSLSADAWRTVPRALWV